MNDRFDTRRAGRERDRYEPERGNARSDRERYELRDRDESGYRGWGGEERDERDERHERQLRGDEPWSARSQDDRDRWRMMDESDCYGWCG